MQAITVHLGDDELVFVDKAAARETRPRSQQVRHYIREAMRRAGGVPAGLQQWPPPLPPVDRLPELEAARDALEDEARKLGVRFGPHDEERLRYLRETCRTLRRQVEIVGGRK